MPGFGAPVAVVNAAMRAHSAKKVGRTKRSFFEIDCYARCAMVASRLSMSIIEYFEAFHPNMRHIQRSLATTDSTSSFELSFRPSSH